MQRLAQELSRLRNESRHRSLNLPQGVDFTSNDYLGLSGHPALGEAVIAALAAGAGAGTAGSRLLRGHQPGHAELEAFARDELGLAVLEPWDLGYASEKLKQARYSYSEQEVKRYFTEPGVLAGLFGVGGGAIIVPVLPSDIDIHAASRCIADLLLVAKVHRSERRLVIVANRARRYTKAFQSLMRFLQSLRIPVAAVLRDSQAYIRSAETGLGLHEMKGALLQEDLDSWKPLVDWLERRSGSLLPDAADAAPEPPTVDAAAEPAAASAVSRLY